MTNQKSKGKSIKKVFALLMAFAMMVTLLPGQSISVLAAEEENTEETYTLTLDYSDGRDVTTISGLTEVPELETPTKEGYTFGWWSPSKRSSEGSVNAGDKLSRDTTIYAIWQKVDDGITYDLHYGGESYKLRSMPYNYDEEKLKNYVIPDMVDGLPVTELGIDSFYSVRNKIETLTIGKKVTEVGEIFSGAGSKTLKKVEISNNVTSLSVYTFANCTALTEITIPAGVREIYYGCFKGCTSLVTIRIEGVLTYIGEYAFANCPNLKTIYYGGTKAQWENKFYQQYDYDNCNYSIKIKDSWKEGSDSVVVKYENEYFVVNFDKNYQNRYPQNMPHYMVVKNGSLITEPSSPKFPYYYNEEFGGWYKDAECTQKWNFETDRVTDDITLYAKWESTEKKVTFNYNGKGDDQTQKVTKGSTITEPSAPMVRGYELEGWYKDAECTQKWNFETDTVAEDMTLYAKWVEKDSEEQGKNFKRLKIGDVLHAGDVIYFPAIPQEEQDKGITCNKFQLLYYSTDPEKPNYYIHHGTDWVYKDQSEYQMPQTNDGSAFSFEIKEIVCNGRVYNTFKIEEKSIRSGFGGTKNYIYDMAVRPMEDGSYDYETPALEHTINATASEGGSISPSGSIKVTEGQNQTFTMTPEEGYEIDTVKVDGTTVTASSSYTFTDVKENHSIEVTFKKKADVPEVVEAPKITSQPKNATIQEGETATFTVTATGTDLTYQWQINRNDEKGFVLLENANKASYTTSVADKSCNGFQYQCVVSNSAGIVTSDTAVLNVKEKETETRPSDDSENQWQMLNRAKEITEKTLADFKADKETKASDLADLVAQALKDNQIYSVASTVTAFQKTEPTETAEGKINGIVTLSIGSYSAEVSFDYALVKTEKPNTTQKPEKIAGTGVQTSNGQVKVSWNAMSDADGYQIYVSLCNGKNTYKLFKDTRTLNGTIKNLDNTKSYKFYVVAYKNVDGKKVRISKSMVYHVTLADGKYTNVKEIKVPKSTYTLDIGEKKKLTAKSVKEDKTKNLLEHAQEFRYYSSDASIAVVSKNGEIKAKKPGSCIIYIVANNGVVKKVKVTVS